jgi:hypothetical protein
VHCIKIPGQLQRLFHKYNVIVNYVGNCKDLLQIRESATTGIVSCLIHFPSKSLDTYRQSGVIEDTIHHDEMSHQ